MKYQDLNNHRLDTLYLKIEFFIIKIFFLFQQLVPYVLQYYSKIKIFMGSFFFSYYSAELVELTLGFILLLLGNNFYLMIIVYITIKMNGWDTLKSVCINFWNIILKIREIINDDLLMELDDDGNGIVSVIELAKGIQKIKNIQKIGFTILKVIDPKKIIETFSTTWIILLSILATLRSQFAIKITIGSNIGNNFQENIEIWIKPELIKLLKNKHPECVKWNKFILFCLTRFICISFSIILTKILGAYHSALKGAEIITKIFFLLLKKYHFIKMNTNISIKSIRIFSTNLLAIYGLIFQVNVVIPFFVYSILSPLFVFESILHGIAYYSIF